MPTATFTYTTPVTSQPKTGARVGSPLTIEIGTGKARLLYSIVDAGGVIPGTDAALDVALTTADLQGILNTVVARAIANGASIPAGTMGVV